MGGPAGSVGPGGAPPAIKLFPVDDTVVLLDDSGKVVSVSVDSGRVLWSKECGGSLVGSGTSPGGNAFGYGWTGSSSGARLADGRYCVTNHELLVVFSADGQRFASMQLGNVKRILVKGSELQILVPTRPAGMPAAGPVMSAPNEGITQLVLPDDDMNYVSWPGTSLIQGWDAGICPMSAGDLDGHRALRVYLLSDKPRVVSLPQDKPLEGINPVNFDHGVSFVDTGGKLQWVPVDAQPATSSVTTSDTGA